MSSRSREQYMLASLEPFGLKHRSAAVAAAPSAGLPEYLRTVGPGSHQHPPHGLHVYLRI